LQSQPALGKGKNKWAFRAYRALFFAENWSGKDKIEAFLAFLAFFALFWE
jgi:hypothetical protein